MLLLCDITVKRRVLDKIKAIGGPNPSHCARFWLADCQCYPRRNESALFTTVDYVPPI
jgi:hypothetical protein